jgi:redox-sensitive bicupin YhaK (pirin superfamily)
MTSEPSLGVDFSALEIVIAPRTRDLLNGFKVQRVLPFSQRRMVGPFIFLDQMGPAVFRSGAGVDVAPHPHIGLATVTYLFEGELLHRDSLGMTKLIRPGEVNWMTAGRGIAHSERTPPEVRQAGSRVFGVQSWVALPARDEETDPAFAHHGIGDLPVVEGDGVHMRLIAGSLYGARSPVHTRSEMFYADVRIESGARLAIPAEHEERAIYLVEGTIEIFANGGSEGETFDGPRLLVLKPGAPIILTATSPASPASPAKMMLLGGAPMDGPRHIWWNFVSSSKERIEQAKADWEAGRFAPVPGETDFVPLPKL